MDTVIVVEIDPQIGLETTPGASRRRSCKGDPLVALGKKYSKGHQGTSGDLLSNKGLLNALRIELNP